MAHKSKGPLTAEKLLERHPWLMEWLVTPRAD
jgi:hypothetical protein